MSWHSIFICLGCGVGWVIAMGWAISLLGANHFDDPPSPTDQEAMQ